jgi:signal transduction histidine kinase
VYSVAVVTIAVGYLPWALVHTRVDWSMKLLLWAGAVAVVDLFFPIEWKGFTLSLSFPLLIAIGILYAPPVAAAIGVLASLDPREFRRSIGPLKAVFNRCEVGLSVLAACTVFHALASLQSAVPVQVGAAAVATLVDLVLTTMLVAVYVRLESGTPVAATPMRQGVTDPRFVIPYLGMGLVALVVAHVFQQFSGWSLILCVAPLALARQLFYRSQGLKEDLELEQEAVAELEDLNRLKGEFVAVASHELRSPLTTLIGYAKTLGRAGVVENTQLRNESVRAMERQGDRLLRLCENLMTGAQLDEGQVTVTLERVVFEDLCAGVIEGLGIRGRRVHRKLPMSVPILLTDKELLGRVLQNVLDNALKYSPDDQPCEVGAREQDGSLVFWVTDRGSGIPQDQLANIFKPFFQSDASNAPSHSGVGLGLSIVHGIVAALGGEIDVESTVGKGTTFTVTLPAVCPPAEAADAEVVHATRPYEATRLAKISPGRVA